MVSIGRRRASSIKRRGPTKQPRQRILVVCEGAVTEQRYFRALQHNARNPRLHVEVAKEVGAPLTVVQIAVRRRQEAERAADQERDDNIRWDQVWGVFDVDAHPNLDEARRLAEAESINLAVSNPCFELWALLHFQEQRAHIERDRVRAALQRHLVGYDKELDFRKLHPLYENAVQRARDLEREADAHGETGRNPTTQVYKLTDVILST